MNSDLKFYIIALNMASMERFKRIVKELCGRDDVDEIVDDLLPIQKILIENLAASPQLYNMAISDEPLPEWMFSNSGSTKYRSVLTVNGHPMDVMKSAMQKYARRGQAWKCSYSAIEMNCFKWMDGGKGAFTNFLNRVRVIFLEDVGVASPWALVEADKWLTALRTTDSGMPIELVKLTYVMSNTPHIRLYSWLNGFYRRHPPVKEFPESSSYDDEPTFKDDAIALEWCLEKKDISAFYYANRIAKSEELLANARFRGKRSGLLPFWILEKILKKKKVPEVVNKSFTVCLTWYKDLKIAEANICIFHPMYLYLLADKLPMEKPEEFTVPKRWKRLWDAPMTNQDIPLDSYVYDKHTKKGRKSGADSVDFAVEGSLVAFELRLPQFEHMRIDYISDKLVDGTVPKESDVFKFKIRAQLVCSGSKQDTYYAKMGSQNVVVKGPYLTYADASKSYQTSQFLKLFEGVNSIGVNMLLLVPDMFESVPLGTRTKIVKGKPYYFLVFDDLFDQEEYPSTKRSSKLWSDEEVVDYDALFEKVGNRFGFGTPSVMTEEGRVSLIIQLAFRYVVGLGDFAPRNFVYVGNTAYNLDVEGMNVGNSLRWKIGERTLLEKTYVKFKERIDSVVKSWAAERSGVNPSFYSRWEMIDLVLGEGPAKWEGGEKMRANVDFDISEWLTRK